MENKDYTQLTREELLIEEKTIKRNKLYAAFGTGFLIGVMAFGVMNNGFSIFSLYIIIPLLLIAANYKNSQNIEQKLKQVQAAISSKNSG